MYSFFFKRRGAGGQWRRGDEEPPGRRRSPAPLLPCPLPHHLRIRVHKVPAGLLPPEVDGAGVSGPDSSGGEDRCAAASVLGAAAGAEAEAGAAATGGCAGRAPRGRARPEAREAGVYATTGRGSGLSGRTAAVAEVAQLPDHGAVGARDAGPGRALDRREVERPAEAKHACAAAGVIMQCELGRMPGAARRDLERVTHARVRPTVSLLALRDLCTRRLRLMPIVGQDLHPARRQAGGLPDTRSTGSSVRGGPAPRRR